MMNTLHKYLTIAFVAVSILISGLIVDFVGAQNTAVGPATTQNPADPLQSRYIKFGWLTAEDGLSSDQTWDLILDKRGFMRFGTANGLSRYGGSSVKMYRHDPDNPNSLIPNNVRALHADRRGVVWVYTNGGGLNKFDPQTENFPLYRHDPAVPNNFHGHRQASIS